MSRISQVYEGRTSMEIITGGTVDIRKLSDFEFYNLFWYWDTPNDWKKPKLGIWLGISLLIGISLC